MDDDIDGDIVCEVTGCGDLAAGYRWVPCGETGRDDRVFVCWNHNDFVGAVLHDIHLIADIGILPPVS